MKNEFKQSYIERMTENLHVLRAKLGATQAELAEITGISRQTILSIEKGQRGMTWNMYLALMYVFTSNPHTSPMIDLFRIRDDTLIAELSKY